jgi:hypothetical protein
MGASRGREAHRAKRSRSELYARALTEYVARHAPDRVTEAMDRALEQVNEPAGKFVSRVARRTPERTEW